MASVLGLRGGEQLSIYSPCSTSSAFCPTAKLEDDSSRRRLHILWLDLGALVLLASHQLARLLERGRPKLGGQEEQALSQQANPGPWEVAR